MLQQVGARGKSGLHYNTGLLPTTVHEVDQLHVVILTHDEGAKCGCKEMARQGVLSNQCAC